MFSQQLPLKTTDFPWVREEINKYVGREREKEGLFWILIERL